jgi:hypothetical protein
MVARICAAIHNAQIIDFAGRNGIDKVKLQNERDHLPKRKWIKARKVVADPGRKSAGNDKVKSFVKRQTAALSGLAGF